MCGAEIELIISAIGHPLSIIPTNTTPIPLKPEHKKSSVMHPRNIRSLNRC